MIVDAQKIAGATFVPECKTAGVTDFRFSMLLSGGIYISDDLSPPMDPDQLALIEQVFTAHDQTSPANAKADVIDSIDALCTAKLDAGYSDAVTGKVFQTDDVSRANFTGAAAACLAALATSNPMTFDLIPKDNQTITGLSATACLAILMRMFGWVSATVIYARDLKNQILAGQNPDITAGWPS